MLEKLEKDTAIFDGLKAEWQSDRRAYEIQVDSLNKQVSQLTKELDSTKKNAKRLINESKERIVTLQKDKNDTYKETERVC